VARVIHNTLELALKPPHRASVPPPSPHPLSRKWKAFRCRRKCRRWWRTAKLAPERIVCRRGV